MFCIVYIDDILIYSNNLTKHQKHVYLILQAIKNTSLHLNINKYEFYKTKVLYLELFILTKEIYINSTKIKTILK